MTKSTDSGISQRTNVYAAGEMLDHAMAVNVLHCTGPQVKPLPKNKSTTQKFRRPVPMEAKTTPLVEGVTPTASTFTYEDVETTIKQFGDVLTVTDVIEDTHEDPVLNDMVMVTGDNIGRTKEALNFGVLRGGTNVFYANGASRAGVNTPLTLTRQRHVTKTLRANKAQKVRRILAPSRNIETFPIEAAYIAVGHTDLEPDVRGLEGFVPTSKYGSRQVICEHEVGSVEDVRYILSPDLPPWLGAGAAVGGSGMTALDDTNVDVYPILIFGDKAWGECPLRGYNAVEPSIIPVGQKSKSDPLGQKGYVGWKMWHTSLILNDAWMARLEVATTDTGL